MLVVLLPGLHGTDGLFAPLLNVVPEGFRYEVCGYSTDKKQSYDELVEEVAARVSAIEEPFIVVGESFSGPIAIALAARRLPHLKGIVLVATFVSAPGISIGRYLPWTLGFRLTAPLYRFRRMFSSKESQFVVDMISTELQRVRPEVLAHRIELVYSVDVSKQLAACEVPIAYFRGRYDFVVPERNLKLILKIRPDVSVTEFRTQHFILQSMPGPAWDGIDTFTQSTGILQ
jgi:pimeloyl-ACP methyl ester carboxylesterase